MWNADIDAEAVSIGLDRCKQSGRFRGQVLLRGLNGHPEFRSCSEVPQPCMNSQNSLFTTCFGFLLSAGKIIFSL